MIIGNPLLLGGGGDNAAIAAYLWGTGTARSGSYATIGTIYAADDHYFTYASRVFTCQKPGNYTISFFGRGGYNTSGSGINMMYRLYAGGSVVASATNVGNGGTHSSVSVTLAVGDTVYVQTANSNNSANTHDFGFVITPD